MTNDELRDLRDAMSAYLEGKTVQYRYANIWLDAASPSFESGLRWRPKPEPATRPWNCQADVPKPVCWIRGQDKDRQGLICYTTEYGLEWFAGGESRMVPFAELKEHPELEYSTTCRADDWHPLTVEVKE